MTGSVIWRKNSKSRHLKHRVSVKKQRNATQHNTMQRTQHNATQRNTTQHNVTQRNTTQHNAM